LSLRKNEIRQRINAGVFLSDGWDLGSGTQKNPSLIKDASDEAMGISDSVDDIDKPRLILEQHRGWDIDGDGIEEPYAITIDYETGKVLRIVSNVEGDEEIEYFTEYTFFPNPEGGYGLGFTTLILGLNEAANTIVNEVIDAGSLANLQGGFYLGKSGLKGKDLKFSQGEYKKIDAFVDDIRKAMFTHEFKGPNQTLYAVLGLLFDFSKLVSSISETMTGQMPASDTPATTVLALIEEGRKVFSTIHKRIHRSFKKELAKLYRLNSLYLDEQKYFKVLGIKNIPDGQPVPIGRVDYASTYDIIPVSDPNITSRAE